MSLANTRANVRVKDAVAWAVLGTHKRDIYFVRQATVAAFEAVKTPALAMDTQSLPGAVRQEAVDWWWWWWYTLNKGGENGQKKQKQETEGKKKESFV